ncbi:calcium:proton antiporter [Phreatobacter stygius]|uniref:Ionic transporter y4hA n=1 Tax=Phreatobacter stygius TaxID=1940610 RepID=A0A4D7AW93_9HYPH|nr:ionic transporter y4hA [Phreatobacter stygius]QCI64201.1 ionic transporter y4hA [Phreatobacter stygius]
MTAARRPKSVITPILALVVALIGTFVPAVISAIPGTGVVWPLVEFAVLVAAVFAAIHHADVVAHRTGEPYGTLVLTLAVTIIEVALIVSIMLAGDGSPMLARETVFAVVMVVCNGLVGICIILGGLRYGEQGFRLPGASAYLVVLMPLATLTLILPNYTTSVPGPFFNLTQLIYVSVATLVLYGVFLYVQTVRHRDYFLSDSGISTPDEHAQVPSDREVAQSVALLILALVGVVLLAKHFAGSVKIAVNFVGAPVGAIGLLVAMLVLLPESIAAIRSAKRNELQKSLNLALGSSLATIGLTIPAVCLVAIVLSQPLGLGLDNRDMVVLILTFGVSLVTFGGGRTNILPGVVHLVLFATYVFLIFAP